MPKLRYSPAADDGKRVPASGRELCAIEMLAYFQAHLDHFQDRLKDRLHMVPDGWRDYRMLCSVTTRLLRRVFDTLPNRTMSRIIAGEKGLELRVMPKSVNPPKDYIVMAVDDFRALAKGLSAGGCSICLGDGATAKGCRLKALLSEYLPPDDPGEYDSCPYAGGEIDRAVGE